MIVQSLFFSLSFGYILENGKERDRKERMKTKHTGEKVCSSKKLLDSSDPPCSLYKRIERERDLGLFQYTQQTEE
jgi:hypothetical protein